MSGGAFVVGLVLMEAAAAAAYAWRRQWPDAGIWLGAAFANTCWIWKTGL